ncbi:MAG: alcohol dehydrogenase catalytic domain-containing protein, partial [Spirochaetota bacterium]
MALMNAALFYGPMDVRIEKTEIPRPGRGEVLVKVKAALTCGTDIKTYQQGHPAMIKKIPSTFGHEFSGDVVEAGEEVEGFKRGMRVTCCNAAPCQKCFYCKNNQQNLCEDLLVLNGAYAEYIIVPERLVKLNLLEFPEHLSYYEAALSEPLGTAVHALRLTEIKQGDTVAVIGCGPLGLMIMRLAVLQGAEVIVLGKGDERLKQAEKFGVRHIIDITKIETIEKQAEKARELTQEKRGVDVAVEAVGKPQVWEEALKIVRKGGKVTF